MVPPESWWYMEIFKQSQWNVPQTHDGSNRFTLTWTQEDAPGRSRPRHRDQGIPAIGYQRDPTFWDLCHCSCLVHETRCYSTVRERWVSRRQSQVRWGSDGYGAREREEERESEIDREREYVRVVGVKSEGERECLIWRVSELKGEWNGGWESRGVSGRGGLR